MLALKGSVRFDLIIPIDSLTVIPIPYSEIYKEIYKALFE